MLIILAVWPLVKALGWVRADFCPFSAIARSLINRPKILLLDEPLGALDLQLRRQMQQELKRLQKKLGITFIYITHDQEEALNMSDRIAVMREGRFEQIGTPAQVYDSPKTAYVARFVGEANIVKGQAGALRGEQVEFAAPGGSAGFLRRGYSFAPSIFKIILCRIHRLPLIGQWHKDGLALGLFDQAAQQLVKLLFT